MLKNVTLLSGKMNDIKFKCNIKSKYYTINIIFACTLLVFTFPVNTIVLKTDSLPKLEINAKLIWLCLQNV